MHRRELLLWVYSILCDVGKAAVFSERWEVPVSSTFERGEEETEAGVEEKASGGAKKEKGRCKERNISRR